MLSLRGASLLLCGFVTLMQLPNYARLSPKVSKTCSDVNPLPDWNGMNTLQIGDNESRRGDFLYRRGTKLRIFCPMVRGLQMGI